MRMGKIKFNRVLIKLSGEALMGGRSHGIDPEIVTGVASEIKEAASKGTQLGIVIGGGNIFRGLQASRQGIERVTADYMGMLATIINCLALQNSLEKMGLEAPVISALPISEICEPYVHRRVMRHLERGRILIFAGGTGHPYFSTDTAAVLRAVEIGADVIIKATKVDGVYDKDPVLHPDAKVFSKITYDEVLTRNLKVMDATAVSLCRDNALPILVLNLLKKGNIKKAIDGCGEGTIIGLQGG